VRARDEEDELGGDTLARTPVMMTMSWSINI
jgi:hypothetical protein